MRFKGVCNLHPLHHFYGSSAEEAMDGIIALVEGLDLDNEITNVDACTPFPDTGEKTNPWWPPFVKLLE